MPELDVYVLIERAREPLARTRQNTPPSTRWRLVRDGGVLGGVTESEEWERLERAIEDDRSCGGSASCRERHGDKVGSLGGRVQDRMRNARKTSAFRIGPSP